MTAIGSRLKDARTRVDLTQAGLAEILGVAPQTIHRWEAGKSSIPAGRLADLALATGTTVDRLVGATKKAAPPPEDLVRAKSGKPVAWWGDVVITFKGRAPSIVRSLSGDAHDDFWNRCMDRSRWFSFIDMSGRLLVVNRMEVERLMLLDEGDDRHPRQLLVNGHDAPASHPLADFFSVDACNFQTDHETDRALRWAAELEPESLTRSALLAAEEAGTDDSTGLAAAVAEVGVLRLARVGELLAEMDDPYATAQRMGGRVVDVHLRSGLTRTVTLDPDDFWHLGVVADQLEETEDLASEYLTAVDDTLVERLDWRNIAWVETSALQMHEAFEAAMKDLGERDG